MKNKLLCFRGNILIFSKLQNKNNNIYFIVVSPLKCHYLKEFWVKKFQPIIVLKDVFIEVVFDKVYISFKYMHIKDTIKKKLQKYLLLRLNKTI